MAVTEATMIGVCAGMGALVLITIVASVTYFYRLGVFKQWSCCQCCHNRKRKKPLPPKNDAWGKTRTGEELEDYIRLLHANSDALFAEEYNSLGPHQSDRTSHTASTEINIEKNRYVAVVPYDQTRVRLKSLSGKPGSNYINASYIDGFGRLAAYVATQAPLKQTISDFWRMVWETQSRTIVMVTNLVEKGRVKGEQYWSECGVADYQGFRVSLVEEQKYSHYVIRQFHVSPPNANRDVRLESGEDTRTIWHYHYTAWPDHGVPDDRSTLTSFIIRSREHCKDFPAPTVVHCSAGVGRTGTFIVLDAQMRQYDYLQNVNIYMYLRKIRTQRNYLVQQECQYIFIYDALMEYIRAGGTRIPTDSIEVHIATNYSTRTKAISTKIRHEWGLLCSNNIEMSSCAHALDVKNNWKNRNDIVYSVDKYRVVLPQKVSVEGSSYINATFMDSHRKQNAHIVTQAPGRNTVDDVWRMVWDEQVCVIVNLLTDKEIEDAREGDGDIAPYIPSTLGSTNTYGEYDVKYVKVEAAHKFYERRHLLITEHSEPSGERRDVYCYHFSKWPTDIYPLGNNLMDFVDDILTCYEKFPELPSDSDINVRPIVIHDLDGSNRACLLSMILHLTEQVRAGGPFVDVYSAVQIMMSRRTAVFTDINDYNYLYKVLWSILQFVNRTIGPTESP